MSMIAYEKNIKLVTKHIIFKDLFAIKTKKTDIMKHAV